MIRCKNLVIGHQNVLFTIPELTLHPGKLSALIGKNGAGKSSFMQTLLGHVSPLSGTCLIENQPINEIKPRQLAEKIAFVSAQFAGISLLNVRDYISLGRLPYTNRLGSLDEEDKRIVQEIIRLLEIEHLTQKDTAQISDGERQIVSIGRALAQQTSILLLDEPTAFLDYPNRILLLEKLKVIAKKQQISILFSTHDLEMSLRFSDVHLVIDPKQKILIEKQSTTLSDLIQCAFPEISDPNL